MIKLHAFLCLTDGVTDDIQLQLVGCAGRRLAGVPESLAWLAAQWPCPSLSGEDPAS